MSHMRIPKLRQGSFFRSLLVPQRWSEKALLAVIQIAYVKGLSLCKVDDLLKALGLTGIDKRRVSRICKELDQAVRAFRNGPLKGEYPCLWLDGLYLKVREVHRVLSHEVVIAIGVCETGSGEEPPWHGALWIACLSASASVRPIRWQAHRYHYETA